MSEQQPVLGLLVTGSRDFRDYDLLESCLDNFVAIRYPDHRVVLIHGAARGADSLAHLWAKARGYDSRPFPANWRQFRKAAGHLRNAVMVNHILSEPFDARVCLAFKSDFDWTLTHGGTEDCCRQAVAAGVPTFVWYDCLDDWLPVPSTEDRYDALLESDWSEVWDTLPEGPELVER